MRRDVRALLEDVRGAAAEIAIFTEGMSFADYNDSAVVRRAVERDLFLIGEAVSRIRRDFPETAAELESAEKIIGLRNRLAHAYETVSHETLWAAFQ